METVEATEAATEAMMEHDIYNNARHERDVSKVNDGD